MDTRTKIVPWDQDVLRSLSEQNGVVAVGYFDPLLAAHAARLRRLATEHGHPLTVVIADPDDPLLPARARAELVAGIADVDRVTIAPRECALPHSANVVRLEQADADSTRDLVRHVHLRHASSNE